MHGPFCPGAMLFVYIGINVSALNSLMITGGLMLIRIGYIWLLWRLILLLGAVGGTSLCIYPSSFEFINYTALLLKSDSLATLTLVVLAGSVFLWQLVERAYRYRARSIDNYYAIGKFKP